MRVGWRGGVRRRGDDYGVRGERKWLVRGTWGGGYRPAWGDARGDGQGRRDDGVC